MEADETLALARRLAGGDPVTFVSSDHGFAPQFLAVDASKPLVDLGLLSCDTDLGADITDLFNVLTGHSRQTGYRKLLVAPAMLRSGLIELIDGERERHEEFGDGRIVIKCNALVDPASIAALYRASQAGVPLRPDRADRRRARALLHRLRRPDGAQSRSARGSTCPGRRR